ncbi:MAG TPA: DUF58 domain-containing protein [Firmicutes bacterium]|nr:DUF58 domain-containing protein [Bacillota bacterium]
MTRRSIAALVLFALLLLAGLATGISEIFVAVFMTGFLLTFALVSSIAGVFVLRVRQSVSPAALVRGGESTGLARLGGAFFLPAVVCCTWDSPDGDRRPFAALLWGWREAAITCPLPCPHRGVWRAEVSRLSCGDIFGLFSFPIPASRRPAPPSPLVVYPELYAIPGRPPLPFPSMEYSEKNAVTADQGDSFADTRPYRSGDPLKRIHWKLSVRTGELHTRQYEMSRDQAVLILLDDSAVPGEETEAALGYADMAAECAAALAYYYLLHGQAVRLLCSAGETYAAGLDDFEALYTRLAGMEFGTEGSFTDWIPEVLADLHLVCACHLITRRPDKAVLDCLVGVPARTRPASLICSVTDGAPLQGEALEQGLKILPVSAPRDILERLGGGQ